MHVSLPHPLAITYLQALDVFGSSQPKGTGSKVAQRVIEYLNTALLSPQMLYLTHQPNALATAAIYLAARDIGTKLPGVEWWEVFDTDREELGFLALGMKSLEGWIRQERVVWGGKNVITREDVNRELQKRGDGVLDEEAEMMRLMDEKVA
jgi:cyclin L